METTKLFFFARGPVETRSWATLMTEEKARASFLGAFEEAGIDLETKFESCRVLRCGGGDLDSTLVSWGENDPGFDPDDYGDLLGLRVELDGKVVFDDCVEVDE